MRWQLLCVQADQGNDWKSMRQSLSVPQCRYGVCLFVWFNAYVVPTAWSYLRGWHRNIKILTNKIVCKDASELNRNRTKILLEIVSLNHLKISSQNNSNGSISNCWSYLHHEGTTWLKFINFPIMHSTKRIVIDAKKISSNDYFIRFII